MQSDIDEVLAYEIKKDIADRYFGFRKLIEDDKLDLDQKIKLYTVILEKRIFLDLIRLYILLKDEELIETFVRLSGLGEKLFYDPYITTSPTIRASMFEGVPQRGLTRSGRFKNLVLDCYAELTRNVEIYRVKREELKESHAAISDEIKLFYRRNDLTYIMQFLRSLSASDDGAALQGGLETGQAEAFEKKNGGATTGTHRESPAAAPPPGPPDRDP